MLKLTYIIYTGILAYIGYGLLTVASNMLGKSVLTFFGV